MHYPLAPSSAHRWANCEGSVLREASYPDVETEEAAEGTASHWVGEQSIKGMIAGGDSWRFASEYVGQKAPNGLIVTDEMAEGAGMYLSDVAKVVNQYGAKKLLNVERRVHAKFIHQLCGGTPDVFLYLPDQHRLYIWDYKFGHVTVEAEENLQGICYYAGIYDLLGFDGSVDQTLDVRIRIIQPRAYHRYGPIREWQTTGGELRTVINRLAQKAEQAFKADALTHAGPWCLHCKAAHDCDTLTKRAQAAMSYSGAGHRQNMRPSDVAFELAMLRQAKEAIREKLTGIEQYAESLIENGTTVPGWTKESTKGRERWTAPPEQIIALGKAFGKDLSKPGLKTPKQAQAMGLDRELIKSYVETPSGAAKLVESDQTIAYKAFNKR